MATGWSRSGRSMRGADRREPVNLNQLFTPHSAWRRDTSVGLAGTNNGRISMNMFRKMALACAVLVTSAFSTTVTASADNVGVYIGSNGVGIQYSNYDHGYPRYHGGYNRHHDRCWDRKYRRHNRHCWNRGNHHNNDYWRNSRRGQHHYNNNSRSRQHGWNDRRHRDWRGNYWHHDDRRNHGRRGHHKRHGHHGRH